MAEAKYPQLHIHVLQCKCGALIEDRTYLSDEYDTGDGGEIDHTCKCGVYYKRSRNVIAKGGKWRDDLHRTEYPDFTGAKIVAGKPERTVIITPLEKAQC
ncbi:hypothetical protein O152_gp194 [Pseudomonas phage PaBG]|uniref:Uncharacterized protein n=1 Tax=Pseudomonas phage PaBG TaxID=1335230 RepID=S5VZT3_9CAUD|nr:hypothetical protein O152_gp194 [Pseudomonas phage PaBG]AGS82165.1 hypothetical protein PaBG_00292 [Pseudomonas phage PaBG]